MTADEYIESVKRNNPALVGKKLQVHWDSFELNLRLAFEAGHRAELEERPDVPLFFEQMFGKGFTGKA